MERSLPATVEPDPPGRMAWIGAAAALSAGVTYLAAVVGARVLELPDNTRLLTFTSLLFVCFGLLSGASTETTRSVAQAVRTHHLQPAGQQPGLQVRAVGTVLAVTTTLLVLVSTPLWSLVLPRGTGLTLALLVVGTAGFAAQTTLVGALVGCRQWALAAGTIAAESVLRVVALGVALAVPSYGALALAMVLGVWSWPWLLCSREVRTVVRTRLDRAWTGTAARTAAAVGAQAASAFLTVGFPLVMVATTSAGVYATSAPLILAITVTRAPFLVPLTAYQGVLVSSFVHAVGAVRAWRGGRVLVAATVLALAVTLAASVAGPPVLVALFGEDYAVDGGLVGGLVVAAMALALLMTSGAACQATDDYRGYLTGWGAALATAVGTMWLLPASLETRTLLALLGGPTVGISVHAQRIVSRRGTHSAEELQVG